MMNQNVLLNSKVEYHFTIEDGTFEKFYLPQKKL